MKNLNLDPKLSNKAIFICSAYDYVWKKSFRIDRKLLLLIGEFTTKVV
jgi:hypothetical protein